MLSILRDDHDRAFNQSNVSCLIHSVIYLIVFYFFAYTFFSRKAGMKQKKKKKERKSKQTNNWNKQQVLISGNLTFSDFQNALYKMWHWHDYF